MRAMVRPRPVLWLVCFLSWGVPALAVQGGPKFIAVTFDDLPLNDAGVPASRMREITERLLATITEAAMPAVGFVNERKLDVIGERLERIAVLAMWLDAGLELGNHTFSHPSLHHTPLEQVQRDVILGERVTNRLLAARGGGSVRFFRHPFLRTGLTVEIKESFERFLAQRRYTIAPVTIENWDWMFNAVYTAALADDDLVVQARVAWEYLRFTEAMFDFHERVSMQLFDRQIRHVLLLHANELNAEQMPEVVRLMERRGYEFVSLERALEDSVYELPDRYAGPAGVSWLFRWDYSADRVIDWSAEPAPPAYIQRMYEALSN